MLVEPQASLVMVIGRWLALSDTDQSAEMIVGLLTSPPQEGGFEVGTDELLAADADWLDCIARSIAGHERAAECLKALTSITWRVYCQVKERQQ